MTLCLALFLLAACGAATAGNPPAVRPAGKVLSVEGTAWISGRAGASPDEGRALEPGDGFAEKDYIHTGRDAKVELVLGASRTRLTLGPDTVLFVESYIRRLRKRRMESSSILSIIKGKLQFITTALFGKRHRMSLKAENATCAVRGTAGLVLAAPGKAIFANITTDEKRRHKASLLVWYPSSSELPSDPDKLYRLVCKRGRGLLPGSMWTWRSTGPIVTPLTRAVVAEAFALLGRSTTRRRRLAALVASLPVRGARNEVSRQIKALRRRLEGAGGKGGPWSRRAGEAGTYPADLPGTDELIGRLANGPFKVEVERVTPLEGNNPLNPSNPLAASQSSTTGSGSTYDFPALVGNAVYFSDTGSYYTAGFDIDAATLAVTMRNDGGGDALIIRTPPPGQAPPPGTMEAHPDGDWGSGRVYDGFPSPPPTPYIFGVNSVQSLSLVHVEPPTRVFDITFIVEHDPSVPMENLDPRHFVLRVLSVTLNPFYN